MRPDLLEPGLLDQAMRQALRPELSTGLLGALQQRVEGGVGMAQPVEQDVGHGMVEGLARIQADRRLDLRAARQGNEPRRQAR